MMTMTTCTSGSFPPRLSKSEVLFSELLLETLPRAWTNDPHDNHHNHHHYHHHHHGHDEKHDHDNDEHHLLNGDPSLPVDHFPFAQQQSLDR